MTMKTEQEIKQMVNTCNQYHSCAACPYNPEDISRFIGDRWKGGCPNYDRKLVYAMGKGYGDVFEYKAEIERLRQEVRDTDKMARNTIEQYRAKNEELENALKQSEDNYSRAFERLKAQQREIEQLKAEVNKGCDNCEAVKQAKIDVLNKVKNCREATDSDCYPYLERIVNKLIKEIENEQKD